jgi:predicted 3-demethylubiquinone-9 3-methyltransferase (glyoxalase superfamily)
MQKITPFLWFDNRAVEAMNFYCSIFKNSRAGEILGAPELVSSVKFELEGIEFIALNGGPMFQFTPAISLFVDCVLQEEVDELWDKLSEGGKKSRCGWLQDKFGLSWQIIPSTLSELMYSGDQTKSKRVMQAMMKMDKIIIEDLQHAYDNEF